MSKNRHGTMNGIAGQLPNMRLNGLKGSCGSWNTCPSSWANTSLVVLETMIKFVYLPVAVSIGTPASVLVPPVPTLYTKTKSTPLGCWKRRRTSFASSAVVTDPMFPGLAGSSGTQVGRSGAHTETALIFQYARLIGQLAF